MATTVTLPGVPRVDEILVTDQGNAAVLVHRVVAVGYRAKPENVTGVPLYEPRVLLKVEQVR